MSEERLVAAIQRIHEWNDNRPMGTEETARHLVKEGFFGEEFQAKAVLHAAISKVRKAYQATDASGRPLFRRRAPAKEGEVPLHVQLDFADEHDWKYTLDEKAKGIAADVEAYQREVDWFANIFGYRYESRFLPSIERDPALSYSDGAGFEV